MKSVITELKREHAMLTKAIRVVESMLEKAGASAGRKKRRKKKDTVPIRQALGRGIEAPAKRGDGRAKDLEAKRQRAAEIKDRAAKDRETEAAS